MRARAREIEKANAKLEHRLQRAPTDEEMAAELGITVDEFQESLLQISNSTVAALDELWTVERLQRRPGLAARHAAATRTRPTRRRSWTQTDLKDRVADAIARLPEREKLVVALYYYENLTLREIGEVLGVTESRVSQLHTKAVLRLRSRLTDRGDPVRSPVLLGLAAGAAGTVGDDGRRRPPRCGCAGARPARRRPTRSRA